MRTAADWAAATLGADTLQGKLAPWPDRLDLTGGCSAIPPLGRPPGLGLPTERRQLPDVWRIDLQDEDGRARVLHELMNHELQAIELLALAVLRFPDAPRGFRRALVATLRDEQRHCALYRDRLLACGGVPGQQPVSGFFWRTLRGAPTPAAFVAGLSMTLETANLDFCLTWERRFGDAGDEETAAVIRRVYEDEVRHVATGLVWFGRWAEGDRLDVWERTLEPPLTPARSRGKGFDREGRLAAGFTPREVARLRVMGGSRGRPPRVVGFDAAIEQKVVGRPASERTQEVTQDLAVLPMFLVGAEDIVIAEPPGTAFLDRLVRSGIEPPRFVAAATPEVVGPYRPHTVEPWGITPEPWGSALRPIRAPPSWDDGFRSLSSKCASHGRFLRLRERDPRGWVEHVGRTWTSPGDPGKGRWVLKAPFSASGTDRIVGQGPLDDRHRRWVERVLQRDGEVLWQPWYERLLDLSVHVTAGSSKVDGVTRFLTSKNGVYRGCVLGSWLGGLEHETLRALNDRSAGYSLRERMAEAGVEARRWAEELGYVGPLSIDLAVVREDDAWRVVWLETNARNTLGRVGLALGQRLDRRARGVWRVERATPELRCRLTHASPMVSGPHGWTHGLLPTNDPSTASMLLTYVDVRS